MAGRNGGIIGPINVTSFGKCTVTSKTSTGCVSLQSGTRVVKSLIVAGGGGAGGGAGGAGAGGYRCLQFNAQGTIPVTVGAGGSSGPGGGTMGGKTGDIRPARV